MARPALADLLRHHTWATIELIRSARTLTPEQLAWSAPGTYGPIDQTLAHIVGADGYYLFRLTGARGPDSMEPGDPVDLEVLERRAGWVTDGYERYVTLPIDPDEIRTSEHRMPSGEVRERRESVGTILAQVLHHGNEHRCHVGTILGAHGITHPDYSGWGWGRRTS